MGTNGQNGKVPVQEYFDLDGDMLHEAILHYMIERGIKNGTDIEWNIDFHEGYNVPKKLLKMFR